MDRSSRQVKSPPIMVRYSSQRRKTIKVSEFVEPAMRHQKSATHIKVLDFEHKMDFEYKMIIVMYHPKSFWFINK